MQRLLGQPQFKGKLAGVDGALAGAEQAAHHHHPDHAPAADEAVFHEAPLVVPAKHPRVDFEGLEQFQFTAELAPGIAHDRHRLVPQRHPKSATAQYVVHAADVGQGEVAAIGDMAVEVQVGWPYAQANDRGGEGVDRLAPRTTKQHEEQSKPEIHRNAAE
ncbi:hypothetical protein D3C73_873980 [compost metagenome]